MSRRDRYADEYASRAPRAVEDLPLFATPVARKNDPITSHAAADSMTHAAEMQRSLILFALREQGPRIADELDVLLDFRPTTSGRRLPELERQGDVVATDETRPTRSGRAARVYQATR